MNREGLSNTSYDKGEDRRPHRKLDVWNEAVGFVVDVYGVTRSFPKTEQFDRIYKQLKTVATQISRFITYLKDAGYPNEPKKLGKTQRTYSMPNNRPIRLRRISAFLPPASCGEEESGAPL